jgi:hypothetical protein
MAGGGGSPHLYQNADFLIVDFSCGFVAGNFSTFKTVHCNLSSTSVKRQKQSGTQNFWSPYRGFVCLLQQYQVYGIWYFLTHTG